MKEFLKKPKLNPNSEEVNKYEKYGLKENPFPSNPVLNSDADDIRLNGRIFEMDIRRAEFQKIMNKFLKTPQADINHQRLGYIMDTSYIGRGNGKSAFIVNLINQINNKFCLDFSEEKNKCFALRIVPESGGRTKTFARFVDVLYTSILRSSVIDFSLAVLRYEALNSLKKESLLDSVETEEQFIEKLNDEKWLIDNKIDIRDLNEYIQKNSFLSKINSNFPIYSTRDIFNNHFVTKDDFSEYYKSLRVPREKLDFIFTDLVLFFEASGFNGAYFFVDDFELIPDFQSAQQKRDFVRELRSCIFDGGYRNATIGFYNFFLVFHAGVPRLVEDAWNVSGMEGRAPIFPKIGSDHIIKFDKLNKSHTALLIKKYLDEYRLATDETYQPFTIEAIDFIGKSCEYNATNILRTSYFLLNSLAESNQDDNISLDFVKKYIESNNELTDEPITADSDAVNLFSKANQ